MKTVGVICEYNPFHNGHLRQLRLARQAVGEDCALVCLMSGNYVQRGEPAIFPKQLRAEAAVRCGADLVLELPLPVALSSAEGFAAGGVSILSALGCELLCFGTESADPSVLLRAAEANLDPAFDGLLRDELATGCAYPAARQRALAALGADGALCAPNDILAVEYYKALLRQNTPMQALPILRTGSYHARRLEPEAPSASCLRSAILAADSSAGNHAPCEASAPCPDWAAAVPECLHALYAHAARHSLAAGERALLARLRTLPDEAFAALPYGSEGLWSKLMKNSRTCASVEEILNATKSKRYTLSRIRRMLLCAFLGLTAADLETPPPYVRALAFNGAGRGLLRQMRARFPVVNAGERPAEAAWYAMESRASDLYSLFSEAGPRPAGEEAAIRVFCSPVAK